MAVRSEEYRLRNYVRGEVPPALYSQLRFECDHPREALERLVPVMSLVARAAQDGWPDDDYWRHQLPEWLMRTFRAYSPEEVQRILGDRSSWADLAWSFGSWLDRMRDRDWQWWSSDCDGEAGRLTISIAIEGYPSSASPLVHLATAAGCTPVGEDTV